MADDFATHETGLMSPAQDATVITPNDSAVLPRASRGIYVGQAGDLRVQMVSGVVVTFQGVQAGVFYPLRVNQVMATGTTAGGLVGLR